MYYIKFHAKFLDLRDHGALKNHFNINKLYYYPFQFISRNLIMIKKIEEK